MSQATPIVIKMGGAPSGNATLLSGSISIANREIRLPMAGKPADKLAFPITKRLFSE